MTPITTMSKIGPAGSVSAEFCTSEFQGQFWTTTDRRGSAWSNLLHTIFILTLALASPLVFRCRPRWSSKADQMQLHGFRYTEYFIVYVCVRLTTAVATQTIIAWERERERERERETERQRDRETERDRERETETETETDRDRETVCVGVWVLESVGACVRACVRVCVCVRER